MSLQDEVTAALAAMILSPSGWRGVFAADGDAESATGKISAAHRAIAAGAAAAFAGYLRGDGEEDGGSCAGDGGGSCAEDGGVPAEDGGGGSRREDAGGRSGARPLVLMGRDTRPTGAAIARVMIPALRRCGCRVRYAGVVAAPEIMAWVRAAPAGAGAADKPGACGFIYISASHNPIGHNGLKFGLADGGVLPAAEAEKLARRFAALMRRRAPRAAREMGALRSAGARCIGRVYKKQAYAAYYRFAGAVAWGEDGGGDAGGGDVASALRRGIARRPLGVCCDFNGSARCVSIDKSFLGSLGIQCAALHDRPGAIAHRIVPEGESLEPCRAFLEALRRRNPAFVAGYVPDCDGDRGNLVIWDEALHQARALEAQEVFALACVAELTQLAWSGLAANGGLTKTAVAVNDPTSLRIDRIAGALGARVFRAEVGEANVVGLARRLREDGWTVRILGEGSAGGNITHPSAVRDPLHTVLALAKLLSLRTEGGKPGLFHLWCDASGQGARYRADYGLADIIASLPPFVTTGAYSTDALLRIASAHHGALKSRYQAIFLRERAERAGALRTQYGIYSWDAAAYNGMEERKGISDFGAAGNGGLKICFYDAAGDAIASLWMRGSATEPVFRVIADAAGADPRVERDLIAWHRRMTTEADRS